MLRQILILTTLLVAKAMTERNQMIVAPETRFQQCNNTSCDCGARGSNHAFIKCNQACPGAKCKTLTCSSGICHQECHNCHMECTSDVDYCTQRCLSGACSFTCNAKLCEHHCNGGNCIGTPSTDIVYKQNLPLKYLITLAVLFALSAILSFLLLVLFLCKGDCCRRRPTYNKLNKFSSSLESVEYLPTFV